VRESRRDQVARVREDVFVHCQAEDTVFTVFMFAVRALAMEEGRVRVAIPEECEARALFGDGALH
jgi:hypothetical protein